MAKFTWGSWDFDGCGDAYVIAKRECPEKVNVPTFIVDADLLDPACAPDMVVEEGWCRWQVRTDWENRDGEPTGGYYVWQGCSYKGKRGWFPVWIVRKGEWY